MVTQRPRMTQIGCRRTMALWEQYACWSSSAMSLTSTDFFTMRLIGRIR